MFAISQVVANSLLGWRERLGVFASAATDPHEYRGGGVFFDVPVTDAGTHLTTTAFKTQSNPTEVPDRDDRYDRERMSLRASGALNTDTSAKLGWSAGFDWDDLGITRDDERLRSEKLRVLEVGGRISGRMGTSSQYLLGLQVRRGLNGFGSTLDAIDLADDPRRKDFLLTNYMEIGRASCRERV